MTASAMILSATAASAVSRPAAVRRDIAVRKISFNNPEFSRGMDISSVISLENSGVSFRNAEGEAEDIFKILSDSGVNYIRVRVWNNPYDKDKNGYGGGNSDLEKAKIIGRRAAENGMKLLVDFHYSDFWADPAKQQEPKEWKNLSVSEKCEKLYDYTKTSLDAIKDDGGDVGMVQIGNETTTGIAGEYATSNVAKLYKSGIKAVRDFDKAVLTVIHFTNPERTEATKDLADMLSDNQVDYDVFAVSYYPYWHGSLENLTDVLSYAAKTYGKYVMVAETSYAYTLDDSDGHANTVSRWANNEGENLLWSFTPQGQAEEVRDVMNAVNNVGEKGLGVFYWEGAWITVGDTTNLSGSEYNNRLTENKKLWESFGSGWASSKSAEYDPDDAGKYYGGSAVDNQTFFDSKGRALPSLEVFKLVKTGSVSADVLSGDADGDGAVNINDATVIQLHLAEKLTLDEAAGYAADIDRNGELNINDASLIQRYLARLSTEFEVNTMR